MEWGGGGLMHVTGGTLQLEQTELTATQLDTNAAGGKKKKERKFRGVYSNAWIAFSRGRSHGQRVRSPGSVCFIAALECFMLQFQNSSLER